mmetsp:Transcript_780/g.1114  ORF Transcript_780/g.1114 Transcript_780/m.1114 type:complete len:119 (-) Transcript_780:15-371(-)
MSAEAPVDKARTRQIKIKTGILKRAGADRRVNLKEKANQEKRIETYKADPSRDEYDVKKQVEVLDEILMMIPLDQEKLIAARKDLEALLESEKDLAETEEYKLATQMLIDVPVDVPQP